MSNRQKRISQIRKNMAKHEHRKLTRKALKQTKTKSKRVRRKDWLEDVDDLGFIPDERIMPRGENERRREVERLTTIKPEPVHDYQSISPSAPKEKHGLVTEVGGGNCKVSIDNETLTCSLHGALKTHETGFTNVVAVGDEVQVNVEEAVVEAVLAPAQPAITPRCITSTFATDSGRQRRSGVDRGILAGIGFLARACRSLFDLGST